MDPKPDVIRRQIDETRESLADKLETLEDQVKHTVASVTEAVEHTVDSVKSTARETVETVKRTFDIPYQVRRHPYALTGAVFATNREAVVQAQAALRFAAGNFSVNDKPTGAVVGRQPFGGSRASGTHDKAGSLINLLRWTSPRTIKETFTPPTDHIYPHMIT